MGRGLVVAGTAALLALAGPLTAGADEPPPLLEAATCAAPTGAPAVEVGPGETLVSFDVAATTRIRGDGAVATNTGCAPRRSDVFVTDGRRATPDEIAAALDVGRTGDWRRPGAWHHP